MMGHLGVPLAMMQKPQVICLNTTHKDTLRGQTDENVLYEYVDT